MRLSSLHNITPGTRLARPLLDEKGLVLLNSGIALSDSMINRLLGMGITSVYIEDARTEDVEIEDVISQETRQEALHLVYSTLQSVQSSEQHPRQFYQDLNGRNIRRLFDTVLHEMKSKPDLLLSVSNIYTTDGFLYHHSVNVALMSLAIGIEYGLSEKQLLDLGVGTLLHDIGKLRLPQEILNKPGRLTPEEYEIIKQHPMIGYEMLRQQDDISAVSAHVALQHHERVDGTGYPRGLKGDEMHIFGKITACADVYEALTANRVYRKGHLPHEALELLLGACGTHFDRSIVELFLKTVAIYPTGLTVKLNTGETGVIIRQNPIHPQRPVIRVLHDPMGRSVEPYELNLMDHLTTIITACEC